MPSKISKYTQELRYRKVKYIIDNVKSSPRVSKEMGIDFLIPKISAYLQLYLPKVITDITHKLCFIPIVTKIIYRKENNFTIF